MNDQEKSDVPFTDVEKNRNWALKHVRYNPNGQLDNYRGPKIKDLRGEDRYILTYVAQDSHCCFAFQGIPAHAEPTTATPISYYMGHQEFISNFELALKIYKKKALEYINKYDLMNKQ